MGASLTQDDDDPEFYYRPTVADADYGAAQSGLFTASYAQTTARVRWEITEELLIARLGYERIEGTTGRGLERTDTGQIAAAFKIEKHFDVQRDYNPQTGEELNVVVENDSDRPWYQREFMRVDWSQNLITSAYELDTLAAIRVFADNPLTYEPVAYQVEDPENPDAPVFDSDAGYFDITNKVFVTPEIMHTPYGSFPACFFSPDVLGGGYPAADCNPVELKLRLSFRRVEDRDYQPVDWDGTRMGMFGLFTNDRLGYDREYGLVDDRQYRFASRHNIWRRSHATSEDGELIPCNTQETTPVGADPDRDTPPITGTADECEAAGAGSRCDRFTHACTLPFRARELRTIPYYYGPDSDPQLFESISSALAQWDGAMRHAVQTGRYAECVRTSQAGSAPTTDEMDACRKIYPTGQAEAEEASPRVFVLCHNPVTTDDDAACGSPGLLARVGDLRYNMANVIKTPQEPAPWGILADAIDPLTGEVVAASVNVWDDTTAYITQLTVDKMRWYLGEISNQDVSTGRYLSDHLSSATRQTTARQLTTPLLVEKQVNARLAGFDRSLQQGPSLTAMPNLGQAALVDWASEQTRLKFGESALGSGTAALQGRLLSVRGSALETQLTTKSYQRLAGLKAAPTSDATLDLASPLRGNAVAFHSQLMHLQEELLAADGRCMLAGPDPSSVDDWAQIMAEKFPLPAEPSASDIQTRNDRWYDYIRRHLTEGVMLHEMGHSMGLRHVFTGSFDALNYHPQYWQLRTRDGEETAYCAEVTGDGESCVGPRWRDPITETERQGLIWRWSHTTAMDYPGDLTQDTLGIGAYDRAAIRFAYADIADVIDDDDVRCVPNNEGSRTCTPKGTTVSSLIDSNFGGLSGPWYTEPRDDSNFYHYSLLGQRMGLTRNCREADTSPPASYDADRDGVYSAVLDGGIVNGTKCEGIANDYVAYSELELEEPGFQQSFGAFGGAERKFDALGRVRHPYMFATDNYADNGNAAVWRNDNGADAYEVTNFLINSYEDAHLWTNYRRNRADFSLKTAFMGAYRRYNQKLKELAKGYGLYNELFAGTNLLDLTTVTPEADGILKANALAASMVFDHFTRILTRPNNGDHFSDSGFDPLARLVLRSTDQQLSINRQMPLTQPLSLVVPDGWQQIGSSLAVGGRPLFNEFDNTKGYYSSQYDAWVGSYYDKTLVADTLTECADNFVSASRDDFVDGRYRNISFATMFPEGVRRLLASALSEDQSGLAWRVESSDGVPVRDRELLPTDTMGFRSFWPADGPEVCWRRSGSTVCKVFPSGEVIDDEAPTESLAIDPELGFEVQKFIAFTAFLNLPESWKADWIDLMRIYRLGTNSDPIFPAAEQATWLDPLSGQTYIAHRHGSELIDGAMVDRGIAARMIDWMNVLTTRAYEVDPAGTDPLTGALIYVRDPDGRPMVKDQRFVSRVKSYQGMLDFMQEVTAFFGFYSPQWRGVF
ncbi:MAG TPA: hypothetical protein VIW29_10010 [Polyangiaceae bacterium]